MKKTILFFAFTVVVSSCLYAQDNKKTTKDKAAKEVAEDKDEEEEEVPPHWHLAEKGLKSFDQRNYEQAKQELEEALKYVDEFPDEDKAKVHYHYAKSIHKTTPGDDLFVMVKLYRSYDEASKYGSGFYKRESEIVKDDYVGGMDRRFSDEMDRIQTGELTKEEAELVLWAAEFLKLEQEVKEIKEYIARLSGK